METPVFKRMLSPPVGRHSFFLFGPRQTGKTTLIEGLLEARTTFKINLLETDVFLKYVRDPSLFRREVSYWVERLKGPGVVFIDEVQKCPSILNEVQALMDEWKDRLTFVLTGSGARKLKRASANLLGGRAWSFALNPLTYRVDSLNCEFSQDIAEVYCACSASIRINLITKNGPLIPTRIDLITF